MLHSMGVCLVPDEKVVYVFGERIRLSPKQIKVLQILMENEGQIISRETLLNCAGTDFEHSDRSVDTIIKRLRNKLFHTREARRLFLETCRDLGYRIPGRRE